jgi:chemotaxis signal transduction protein
MDGGPERLLTFEVGGAAYALPIVDVIEVAEVGVSGCVPTLPRSVAGVVNHHGDALAVVTREAIFDLDGAGLPAAESLLVLGEGSREAARMGLPVDRVLGLASLDEAIPRSGSLVAARRPIDGRVVHILSTGRLLARAAEAVEQASQGVSSRNVPAQGG